MPERTRKRVFRRNLHRVSIRGDSQAVLQKLVQEANGYLLKIADLEEGLQPHSCDVKDGSVAVPKARAVTDHDVKASLQRLDEATAFLRQIAGLEEPHPCDVEASAEVPEARAVTSDDVNANLQRLDEATDFMLQIAGLGEQSGQELENTEKKENVGTELYGVGDSAAHTGGEDGRLWDEFVIERPAKKGSKELVKDSNPKSWLRKLASRLFRRM